MYAAKIKYKKFVEAVLCRGAVRAGIKANCIFQACKEAGVNRTSKEISDAFGIQERDISRTTDKFKEQNPDTEEVHMTMPKDLVTRFFNSIEVEDKGRVKMKCFSTCQRLEPCVKLQGRTPKAVACAVIFVLLNGKLSKKEICEICGVSLPTLAKLEPIVRAELNK
jgi:transcription initiation factor TFIIIB Brf1 subunit/transcription initiation factor TFIIB